MIKRDEFVRIVAAARGDAVIVAHYKAAFDLMRVAPSPLNYYSIGAMGQGSSHALGFALGMPDRRILSFDGDGSLLMNLGSLVTIVSAGPRNLTHLVLQNGCYETNGSHPLPAVDRIDFAGMARSAGYRQVFDIATLDELHAALPTILNGEGPIFGCVRIEAGDPSPENFEFMNSAKGRDAFRQAIKR